ncbi:hypothetical protein [Streptomyces sp. NPDC086182]|uniref:hypothetical protein n=1 Tax=Streptomyces sp. NPDC086182 TaxID=3155058 RepID=UPI003419942F
MNVCGLCERPLEYGYLCPGDTLALVERLQRLPALAGRLSGALAPVTRGAVERVSAGHPGPSSPLNESALNLWYGGMASVLERWRSDVQSWRGWDQPVIERNVDRRILVAARWLGMNVEWIAAEYPSAGDLAKAVRALEGEALSVLGEGDDRGRRIGQCVAIVGPDGAVCGAPLRHRSGETSLVCQWCKYVYEAGDFLMLRHFQPAEGEAPTPGGEGAAEAHPSHA